MASLTITVPNEHVARIMAGLEADVGRDYDITYDGDGNEISRTPLLTDKQYAEMLIMNFIKSSVRRGERKLHRQGYDNTHEVLPDDTVTPGA